MISKYSLFALLSVTAFSIPCGAAFTPGNLIISHLNEIKEYTPSGSLVQSIPIPYPTATSSQAAADIVYDPAGFIHVRNMSSPFTPDYLSTFDVKAGTWQHTEAILGESGTLQRQLTQFGDYLFTERIKFDVRSRTYEEITFPLPPPVNGLQELTLGNDGLLYASDDVSPSSRLVSYDPATLDLAGTQLQLFGIDGNRVSTYGVDVTSSGEIFIAEFDGNVVKFTSDGDLLANFDTTFSGLSDIVLNNENDLVAVAQRNSHIFVFDDSLDVINSFSIGNTNIRDQIYIDFVPIPEPSPLFGLVSACFALAIGYRTTM